MTDVETVSVKAEHLVEGMIAHTADGCMFTVSDTEQHWNPFGPDDVQVWSTTNNTVWLTVGDEVPVEA
jgi:hypothetical protein